MRKRIPNRKELYNQGNSLGLCSVSALKRLKAVAIGNASFAGVLEARLPYTAPHMDFLSLSEDSSGEHSYSCTLDQRKFFLFQGGPPP